MDLTKDYPRSPNDMLAGIVSLPRMIDKTRADAEGTLGEYDVDCPHDKPVLAFLGVDFAAFAAKLKENGDRYDLITVPGAPHAVTAWGKFEPNFADKLTDWLRKNLVAHRFRPRRRAPASA